MIYMLNDDAVILDRGKNHDSQKNESLLIPKLLEIEKEIVRGVARSDKPYLRKSTDRKAQIRKAFV